MQERYACLTRSDFSSSGHTRHAVFTCPLDPSHSALLAINVHALRSYRMLSVNFLAVESAMPLAPVLIQFWGMKPTCAAEVSQRQYGIMTTLLFIERVIGRSAQATTFERHGYAITEPGFEIYDYLPEFLAMFHGSEQLLRAHLFEALHMESVYEAADAESPGPSNLCGMIAAFLFQKRPHFVSYQFIADLHKLFHDSNVGFQLKERCPEAWRVINVTYSKRQKPVWVLLDLDPHRKRKSAAKRGEGPLEMPPAYYLYRLALIDGRGLLTDLQRLNICKGMRLMETRQPASSSVTSLLYADAQALEYYHQALARPSSDPIQSRLTQYSLNSRDLWPLDSLFIVLRALDYHRQRAAVPRQSWTDDFEPPTEYSVVDGPLNIQDCTDYFVRYLNLPVAHMNAGGHNRDRESPSLAYLDDTLWVWGSGLKGPHTALMEAELLIRDPAFYLVD